MKLINHFKICILLLIFLKNTGIVTAQSVEIENVAAELGDTVLVPLNFSGLQNLGAITLYIIYDPSSIEYIGITNIITQASEIMGNGGYQPLPDTTAIGIAWTASTGGVNFPDGKILDLKLVFNNINSSLNFFDSYCEITDWDANPITVTYQDGGIYINQGAPVSVWTGTGNWTDEANWSNGIPGAITRATIETGLVNIFSTAVCNKLIINSGTVLIIHPQYSLTVLDSVMINGNFTIRSDETGTGSFINQGKIATTGSVVVERFLTSNDHLISSPVTLAQASVFSGADISRFNEATQEWVAVPQTDPLEVTHGYKISANASAVYSFTGNLNYGNIGNDGLSYTASGLTNYPDGMNLCGNPYPSAISWNSGSWVRNNLHTSVYTWNGTQYISWNGEIGSLKDGVIPSGQGFIVFATNANAEMVIPNDARIHNNQPFYGNEKDITNMLEITVYGNGYDDRAFVQFKFGATYGFDPEFDAYKITGLPESPQIYTHTADGIKASINLMPGINSNIDTTVSIGFNSPANGYYDFEFKLHSFTLSYDLYLKDVELDSLQSLSADSIYSFNSDQGLVDERFLLYFKKPSAVNDQQEWNINVYACGNKLFVNLGEFLNDLKLEIYNIDGRLIKSGSHQNVISFQENLSVLQSGIYIFRLTSGSKVYAGKIFLK